MTSTPDVSEKTDEEIAVLALDKQVFFSYLIERYEKKLMSYVLRISNFSFEEAEDILQDVFIKVYKNLNDFDPDLKFSSWIYRIAHNQVVSAHRKKQARPQGISIEDDEDVFRRLAGKLDAWSEADSRLSKDSIEKVLDNLDVKYREVLVLRFFEEKDYREISDILKKPMGTVATLLNRAKAAFKKEMEKQRIIL